MGRRVTQLATPMASADQVVAVERSDAAERNFEKTTTHTPKTEHKPREGGKGWGERERVTESQRQTDRQTESE